jgi:hypothetical protein
MPSVCTGRLSRCWSGDSRIGFVNELAKTATKMTRRAAVVSCPSSRSATRQRMRVMIVHRRGFEWALMKVALERWCWEWGRALIFRRGSTRQRRIGRWTCACDHALGCVACCGGLDQLRHYRNRDLPGLDPRSAAPARRLCDWRIRSCLAGGLAFVLGPWGVAAGCRPWIAHATCVFHLASLLIGVLVITPAVVSWVKRRRWAPIAA